MWCGALRCGVAGIDHALGFEESHQSYNKHQQAGSTYGFGNVSDTKQDSNGSKPDAEAGQRRTAKGGYAHPGEFSPHPRLIWW